MKGIFSRAGASLQGEKGMDYGVQLRFELNGADIPVRLFENKKGRLTVDLSLIRDQGARDAAKSIISSSPAFAGALSPKGKGAASPAGAGVLLSPPLVGSDESGKGDYFSGVYAAAVHAGPGEYSALEKVGVRDSKTVGDADVAGLCRAIREICPVHAVAGIGPEEFNASWDDCRNVNVILSGLHFEAVSECVSASGCGRVLTDRFSSTSRLAGMMGALHLEAFREEPRAEANMAVAAASLLAREAFLDSVRRLSAVWGIDVPLGAGPAADRAAREFVRRHGRARLREAVKISFKNTSRVSAEGHNG